MRCSPSVDKADPSPTSTPTTDATTIRNRAHRDKIAMQNSLLADRDKKWSRIYELRVVSPPALSRSHNKIRTWKRLRTKSTSKIHLANNLHEFFSILSIAKIYPVIIQLFFLVNELLT